MPRQGYLFKMKKYFGLQAKKSRTNITSLCQPSSSSVGLETLEPSTPKGSNALKTKLPQHSLEYK